MARWTRIAVTGGLAVLLLASPGRALADDVCVSLLDTCPTDAITVDPEDTLDDPIGTVTDTVDDVEDTVDPVVGPVLDVVDDLLGDGGIVDPPGGDGPRDHGGGLGPKGPKVDGREGSVDGPTTAPTGPTPLVLEAASPQETLISAASGSRPVAPHGAPGRPGGLLDGAVRGLLLLLALFGLTVTFVVLQDRVDRNDPKLALAPVRAEVVTFG